MRSENERPNNNSQGLQSETAIRLAARLEVIHGFPRRPEALEAVAEWLIRTCQGRELNGKYYSPVEQAEWLINTAVEILSEWLSPVALRELFLARFFPAVEEFSLQPPKEPEHRCPDCDDYGITYDGQLYAWCHCSQTELIRRQRAHYVELLNSPTRLRFKYQVYRSRLKQAQSPELKPPAKATGPQRAEAPPKKGV